MTYETLSIALILAYLVTGLVIKGIKAKRKFYILPKTALRRLTNVVYIMATYNPR